MSDQIKFYTDEHVHPAVVAGLRRRGIEVLSCQEAKMLGKTDEEHLEFAKSEGYTIFSQDTDFLVIHAKTTQHSGIVYASLTTSIGEVIQGLTLIHFAISATEMKDHLEFI